MNAAIITIGDEILIGQIINTNAAWLAENLNLLGIDVDEMISVADREDHILESLAKYEGNKDLVLMTGGLGPTGDDITKPALAKYFGSALKLNQQALGNIEKIFKNRGFKITDKSKRQAMLPDNCKILINPSGTASGMWFKKVAVFLFLFQVYLMK